MAQAAEKTGTSGKNRDTASCGRLSEPRSVSPARGSRPADRVGTSRSAGVAAGRLPGRVGVPAIAGCRKALEPGTYTVEVEDGGYTAATTVQIG